MTHTPQRNDLLHTHESDHDLRQCRDNEPEAKENYLVGDITFASRNDPSDWWFSDFLIGNSQ